MYAGDAGGEWTLGGTGARGDWQKDGRNGLAGDKSVAKMQNPAGGNTHAPKTINSAASLCAVFSSISISYLQIFLIYHHYINPISLFPL
jgi:hypothetical protein